MRYGREQVRLRLSRRVQMGDFRSLIACQKAHALMLAVHAAFRGRSARDAPGLRSQVLRAVSSIPDNLAEGCAKRSRRELARFAEMAYASGKEVVNQLLKSRDLGILPRALAEDLITQCDEVCRLCYALARMPPSSDKQSRG